MPDRPPIPLHPSGAPSQERPGADYSGRDLADARFVRADLAGEHCPGQVRANESRIRQIAARGVGAGTLLGRGA